MNDFGARKSLVALAAISAMAVFQGCTTTRGSIENEMASINQRFSNIEGQMAQVQSRIPAIENRLATTERKVEQVSTKAEQADAKADQNSRDLSNLRLEKRLDLDLKDGVLYAFDSARLSDEAKKNIDVFLSDLKGYNNGKRIFVIAGHADSRGTDRYNYQLGRKRAESVAEYLILDKKIDPMQVVTVSLGESSPLADNQTSEGQGKNRRVEIRVFSEVITASSGLTTAQR
jgi:outer membrane protein OmpA-like peptidoglycan-associated protein